MEVILSVENINKKFGSIHAVKDISFTVEKGNVYGILGPNGSGKSTTLGIILNVVNKTSGNFNWFNAKLSTHQALKKVGAIIERPNFYPYMTAYQNLQLICKIKEVSFENIEQKLEIVNLHERKDSKFKTFSLGMKQRLAIASALLNDPEVLILDEPTNGLDPQGIHEIREIIKTIAGKGTTVLFASHLLDEVEKVCNQVIVIKNGVKLYGGPVTQMTASKGFFELKTTDDQSQLLEILESHPAIGSVAENSDFIVAHLTATLSASQLNRYVFEKGIILSHLVKRKPNLEQQFLDLTS